MSIGKSNSDLPCMSRTSRNMPLTKKVGTLRVGGLRTLKRSLPHFCSSFGASSGTMIAQSGGYGKETESSSAVRSEEHTSELQSLMRSSYAVFCLKKQK